MAGIDCLQILGEEPVYLNRPIRFRFLFLGGFYFISSLLMLRLLGNLSGAEGRGLFALGPSRAMYCTSTLASY